MPPPDPCTKFSTRSTVDNESEIENIGDCNNPKTNSKGSICQENSKLQVKLDSVGVVKSFLGPSLEDAVLRTLEFGKSLIQAKDEPETVSREKKMQKQLKKNTGEKGDNRGDLLIEWKDDVRDLKSDLSGDRTTKKRIVFTAKLDKEMSTSGKTTSSKKPGSLSKIRSLDSDLKQTAPSPEKIKRQLEALIQINKDEPPEAPWSVFPNKTPKIPMNVTVMPTMCVYRNEANFNCPSTCDVQSPRKMALNTECGPSSTSKLRGSNAEHGSRRRLAAPCPISQAPEFISNALGPTLDVSIIDNLKMMRNIFKCDSGKGEGKSPECSTSTANQLHKGDRRSSECCNSIRLQEHPSSSRGKTEDEMKCRIIELERRIEELQQKEKSLVNRIAEEERERELKRRAFEEERKLNSTRTCMESMCEADTRNDFSQTEYDSKYENLKQRICCEEEKLSRLKDQYECYRREIVEAKNRKEALKRNKSLLDAWDVIASRVCHTRLPSFSRAYNLERKQLKAGDASNLHCCFPGNDEPPKRRSRSRSPCSVRCSNRGTTRCRSQSQGPTRCGRSGESCRPTSQTDLNSSGMKQCGTVPFPLQRDTTCGLHQILKRCNCSEPVRVDAMMSNSDDELFKKCTGPRGDRRTACRSRSDTTMKNKCSKIVKVMWAITRINIFQDNCRTYEVMNASSHPPACTSGRTEGIFVVKNPRSCEAATTKRRSHHRDRC